MGLGEITKEMEYIKITVQVVIEENLKKSKRKYILIYFYSPSFY